MITDPLLTEILPNMLLSVYLVIMDAFVTMNNNYVHLVKLIGLNTLNKMNVYLVILIVTNG